MSVPLYTIILFVGSKFIYVDGRFFGKPIYKQPIEDFDITVDELKQLLYAGGWHQPPDYQMIHCKAWDPVRTYARTTIMGCHGLLLSDYLVGPGDTISMYIPTRG